MKERVEGWLRETQPCSQTAQAHWEAKQTTPDMTQAEPK